MNIVKRYRIGITLLVMLVIASGCASMQPLSNYARSGDTVVISLGGSNDNALVALLKKENVTVTITDSANATYPVKLRNLFRLNSDASSKYAFRSRTTRLGIEGYVDSHQGLWMAMLDLVDPVTDTPLPLATGSATLSVASADIQNWVSTSGFNFAWENGNLNSIPIEILAGSGAPNPMNYLTPMGTAPLDSLEPNPQIEVAASGTPTTLVGGASFVIELQLANFSGSYGVMPMAVLTDTDTNIQLLSNTIDPGDGTLLLHVSILNPHGFKADDSKTGLLLGQSLRRNLRFTLVWSELNTDITDMNWQDSLRLVSGEYFDIEGNDLPELSAVLTKLR